MIEGFHALKHALRFGAEIVEAQSAEPGAVATLAAALAPDVAPDIERIVEETDPASWGRLSPRPHPTGVIALALRPVGPDPLVAEGVTVVLERPRRPNNVGAAARVTAAAGGAGLLVVDGADPWSPEAVRTGAGLQFAIATGSAARLGATDRPIVALDPAGDPDGLLPDDALVCFGTERDGLSPELRARAETVLAVPMRAGVSSLNLATAVAATLYRSA